MNNAHLVPKVSFFFISKLCVVKSLRVPSAALMQNVIITSHFLLQGRTLKTHRLILVGRPKRSKMLMYFLNLNIISSYRVINTLTQKMLIT